MEDRQKPPQAKWRNCKIQRLRSRMLGQQGQPLKWFYELVPWTSWRFMSTLWQGGCGDMIHMGVSFVGGPPPIKQSTKSLPRSFQSLTKRIPPPNKQRPKQEKEKGKPAWGILCPTIFETEVGPRAVNRAWPILPLHLSAAKGYVHVLQGVPFLGTLCLWLFKGNQKGHHKEATRKTTRHHICFSCFCWF